MRKVYKYPVTEGIVIHKESKIIHFGFQNGNPFIWVEVNTESPEIIRSFIFLGTGHEIPLGSSHIGSFQNPPFVWHVYEQTLEPRTREE